MKNHPKSMVKLSFIFKYYSCSLCFLILQMVVHLLFCLVEPPEYCGIISSIVLHFALGHTNITKLVGSSVIPIIWIVSDGNVCLQYGQRIFSGLFSLSRLNILFPKSFNNTLYLIAISN